MIRRKTGYALKRLIRNEEGAAAVEAAFGLPVFLLTMALIIEFGRLIYAQGALMFAAEETTRFATVHYDATVDELAAVAQSRLYAMDKANILGVDVVSQLNAADQTKLVTIGVRFRHQLLVPLLHSDGFVLTGTSRGFLVEK